MSGYRSRVVNVLGGGGLGVARTTMYECGLFTACVGVSDQIEVVGSLVGTVIVQAHGLAVSSSTRLETIVFRGAAVTFNVGMGGSF